MRRSTLPSTARRHTQVPPYEWDGSLFGGSGETGKPPSTTPQGVGMAALGLTPQGFRALRGAVQDAKVFRAVRGAGVSLAAASGCFARCGGRPGLCPWTPEFFREKIQ